MEGGQKKNVPSQQIPPQARAAQGPFVQRGCQPPATAPSPTSALPGHLQLFRCLKDAIMPCMPRGANTKGTAEVCLDLAHAYPILAPMAEMSLIPHTTTAWRTHGQGAASTARPLCPSR